MKIIYIAIILLLISFLLASTTFAALPDISVQATDVEFSNTSPAAGEHIDVTINIQNSSLASVFHLNHRVSGWNETFFR